MSYWKATEAVIENDGLAVTLRFKDVHSCSEHRMTLPAETWKNIMTYMNAYDEPQRRMYEAQKRLIDYWAETVRLQLEKKEEPNA